MATAATTAHQTAPTFIGDATSDQTALDKLVAAFVRIRSVDRLEGAIIARYWLATDMGVTVESLDGLLKLLRWQGLISLPDEHIVVVKDAEAMRAIALGRPDLTPRLTELSDDEALSALPIAPQRGTWH